VLLEILPTDFNYVWFGAIVFMSGVGAGLFASPNRAGVMNSLPASARGAGGGMNTTFQNSAQVLSIGVFFTLMIIGLSGTLPHAIAAGLRAGGVSGPTVSHVANLPPVSVVFAAFLGYNPIQHLVGSSALSQLPPSVANHLTSTAYFPSLISGPFRSGLHEAFGFAIAACLVAAVASWSRGGRYVDGEVESSARQESSQGEQAGPTEGNAGGEGRASVEATA